MDTIMKREIFETPKFLEMTAAGADKKIKDLTALIKEKEIKTINIAARGSSANAGLYFKYLCEINTDIAVSEIHPSVITVYNGKLDMSKSCLLAISQGGRGVDIRMVLEKAVSQKALTVSVTAFPDSPVGRASDMVIPLFIDTEKSMAATKSFTAELLVLNMLASALAGGEDISGRAAEAFKRGLEKETEIAYFANKFVNTDIVYVIGRGKTFSFAKEMCCKLQETCLLNAFPFSAADFMHGPFALVEKGSRAILFHSRYGASDSVVSLYNALIKQGAEALLITDDESFKKDGAGVICVPSDNEDETIFSMTAVLQLFACELSGLKGTDPDTSRNLNKYTQTI